MLKKIFIGFLIAVLLLVGGLVFFMYKNQSYVKQQLIVAINKQLAVPVDVKDIQLAPLSSFPDLTVKFYDVVIQDPHHKIKDFASAEEVGFSFNIWDFMNGQLVLTEVFLSNGFVSVIQYDEDRWSYQIYKEGSDREEQFEMELSRVSLKNVEVLVATQKEQVIWDGTVEDAIAKINVQGPVTWINTELTLLSNRLLVESYETLVEETLSTKIELVVDKHWTINTESLTIGDSKFALATEKDDKNIRISFDAKDANLQTLLRLTPDKWKKRLAAYRSEGHMTATSRWRYDLGSGITSLEAKLNLDKVSIDQPDLNIEIDRFDLQGLISIPTFNNLSSSQIFLNKGSGIINGKAFNTSVTLENLKDPYLRASFDGELPLALLSDLATLPLKDPSGYIGLDLNVRGRIEQMKKTEALNKVAANGEIQIKDISFSIPDRAYNLSAPSGAFILNNDQLAFNNLILYLGSSHMKANGQILNFWNISSDGPWSVDANVKSENLNLDELLSSDKEKTGEEYQFNIPDNIKINLDAQLEKLTVRNFAASDVRGKVSVKDKTLYADQLSFAGMDGKVKMEGTWADLDEYGSSIKARATLNGIAADKLFHSFENFNQTFITDEHLSGKLYANIETSLQLTSGLQLKGETLIATINTRIREGGLTDFEPLYQLEKYLNNADLSEVKFADLENQITIQDKTVNIPMMAVGTNVVKFKIGGSHTFDQHIDYNVIAPLIRKKRKDRDERFGTVANDRSGESMLFLSIIGTTSDFTVSLDREAIKNEIVADVNKEINELKEAFHNKGKEEKEVTLEEDDYFEWEENLP